MIKLIETYKRELHNCLEQVHSQDVKEVADIILDAYKRGGQIFIMGNGGSATTASHFARDLSWGTAVAGKPRLQAISLTDNIATITALANDFDYSCIFKEQLAGHLSKGDVVIGISASGNSPNVLEAIEFARSEGALTVGFIGFGGGKLKRMVDKAIVLSAQAYGPVEDIHLSLAHIISGLIGKEIGEWKISA